MVFLDDGPQYREIYESIGDCNNNNSQNGWAQIAEATMPLTRSKMASANRDYTHLSGDRTSRIVPGSAANGRGGGQRYGSTGDFQASIELGAKEISRKLIWVNAISLLVNLLLALVAFYFAYVNNSSATSAFAADCVLDFISSAIVLWRYCGDDLSSVYRQAREQIACIYLGALFELSAIAIIVKATSDMVSGVGPEELIEVGAAGYDLVYLAVAATIACSVLLVFKCALYKTIRDNSILLDVINTLVSTVFAMSIIMSQALINVNPSFWYLDPVISIVLALFMAAFGLKVIHQNFNILRPVYRPTSSSLLLSSYSSNYFGGDTNNNNNKNYSLIADQTMFSPPIINACPVGGQQQHHHFGANLNASIEHSRNQASGKATQNTWQKSSYSAITFV